MIVEHGAGCNTMLNNARHYFDVITVLAQKDFKVRYRNSVLGFLWSLLNPLAYMLILTLVFSLLLRVNIPNYTAWVLLGLLIWRFFSIGTGQGMASIVGNASLVTKVYLPRQLIVLSSNLANLFGATLEFVALLPLLVIFGVDLTAYALYLPVVLVCEFFLIFGVSLTLSSLNVRYRDFNQVWDIVLQLGFFLTPIFYDGNLVPERYRSIYSLNPVTRLIESTRTIFLRNGLPSLYDNAVIVASIVLLLLVGLLVFGRLERRFAEEI
jgi:lipopolysaccharide transport system permease protein